MEPRSRRLSEFATSRTNLSEIEAILDAKSHPARAPSRWDARPIKMLVVEGGGTSPIVVYPETKLTIGRSDECDLTVSTDGRISRVHCEIQVTIDGAMVHDRFSTNGTYLNGIKVQSARLVDRDRVLIGATILTIRIVCETGPS